MNSLEFPARYVQFSGLGGADVQADSVEFSKQFFYRKIDANVGVGQEGDSLLGHEVNTALDHVFFQLEFGDAQDQQAADVASPFDDRDQVSGAVQLLSCGQA